MRIHSRAGGMAVGALFLLVGVLVSAQTPKMDTAETTHLIDSIQGPALYTAYCAVCHGADGKGAGPMAKSLKAALPDLTRISLREGGKFPLLRMEHVISGEEPLPAGHGTRDMPVWGPIFSQVAWDQDLGRVRVFNLAKYLESIQAK